MPRLISLSDFQGESPLLDPRLYFRDASQSYASGRARWSFSYIKDYPHAAYIHRDVIEDLYGDDNTFFVELRRWVERRAEGDLIFQYKNMGHKYWWNKKTAKGSWDKDYSDIKHGYWQFNFEVESDLNMFALMHGEKLSTPQKYHPDYSNEILMDETAHDPKYY